MIKDTLNTLGNKAKAFWSKYKTSKLAWFIAVVVVIIIIVVATGGKKTEDASVATVERANLVDSVVLSGRTQSASAVSLGFADQGRVAYVNVKEGDTVRQGQILASLDTSDLSASLQNARASLTIAKAGVTTSTNSLDKVTREQDALVANAYRNLLSSGLQAVPDNFETTAEAPKILGSYEGAEGEYKIRVYSSATNSGSSFDISGLENGFTTAVTPNTSVPLGSKGLFIQFGSSNAYAGSTWTVSIPNTRSSSYVASLNAYNAARAGRDRAISDATSQLDSTNIETSIAQARVQQAESSVNSILSQISRRRIVAPFTGVVSNINLKPGQSTSAISTSGASATNGNSITLISENDYEVVLKVPEISVAKLSVGQTVDISLDAYGKGIVFPGQVTSINPAETIIDGVPVYETKVTFTGKDDRIRSGMTATATIVAATKENALSIPASMVKTDKEGSYVNVLVSDDKTERRAVTTGLRSSESQIEIISGLAEGDRVRADAMK